MWLVNTTTLRLEEVVDLQDYKYAILSHTWEQDEVEFQEMLPESRPARLLKKAGFLKIKKTCEVAKERGYAYAWIDTCCIDKTSSATLSEAINSMFRWYKESSLCLAYLSDLQVNNFELPESQTSELMKDCLWFTRGWTLQELIAPEELDFYDQEWNFRGSKKTLRHGLSRITGIDVAILEDSELLPTIPVGQRMSWAAHRNTKRIEDIAYCLFGIFGFNMPMIYGEGKNSFLRLQEEIAKRTNDLTLFAWRSQNESGFDRRPTHSRQQHKDLRGIFAQSPSEFVDCGRLEITREIGQPIREFALTNNGLRIETVLGSSPDMEYVLDLECLNEENRKLGICLMKTESGFVRDRAYDLFSTTDKGFWNGQRSTIYIARTLNSSLALRLKAQLLRSLKFHFHVQPRGSYTVQRINARPASLWDNNGKLFLTGNRQDFTACIEFTLRPIYWRFVIVCGLIDVSNETPLVSDLWDEGDVRHGATPWMAIFSDLDPADEVQLKIIDKLKNSNDELRKLRSTVLSWYVDKDDRLPLRKMAETRKTAFNDDGTEIAYHLSMIKERNSKGTPVFNIIVSLTEMNRVEDASTTDSIGSEEDTDCARTRTATEREPPEREPPERAPPERAPSEQAPPERIRPKRARPKRARQQRALPERAPQPLTMDHDPPPLPLLPQSNPFSPQPRQLHPDPGPYAFSHHANAYPHGMPVQTYGPVPVAPPWAGPPVYYPTWPGYSYGGARPAGYR